uniref:B30.2/SPRY domain-containing protein n=1 Tax=Neogobius melanostomus TaxID=47308 RepID=A0A8C6WX74_9GOBI
MALFVFARTYYSLLYEEKQTGNNSCEFSLDPNTAQKNLLLSEDKLTVTGESEEQQYPDHKDRFMDQPQVLSSTGLTGRCYWEVQWTGRWRGVDIAVSYKIIRQRGDREECEFGHNDQSWRLRIVGGGYFVCHNKRQTYLSSTSVSGSGRVGVFLDSEAGALSFYEVGSGGKLFHIYTFTSSFTEPLFPGFGLWYEYSALTWMEESLEIPGSLVNE